MSGHAGCLNGTARSPCPKEAGAAKLFKEAFGIKIKLGMEAISDLLGWGVLKILGIEQYLEISWKCPIWTDCI